MALLAGQSVFAKWTEDDTWYNAVIMVCKLHGILFKKYICWTILVSSFFFEFLPLSLIYDPTFCLFIQQSYIPVRLGIDGEMLPGDVRVLREPGEGPPLTHQDQGTGQSHPNMQ